MRAEANNRRYPRFARPGKVRLHWRDRGGCTFQINARCLDISRTGVKLEIARAIEPLTLVNLHSPEFRIAGVAVVRHCDRKGLGWVAGLQFAGGLEWFRAPEEG